MYKYEDNMFVFHFYIRMYMALKQLDLSSHVLVHLIARLGNVIIIVHDPDQFVSILGIAAFVVICCIMQYIVSGLVSVWL